MINVNNRSFQCRGLVSPQNSYFVKLNIFSQSPDKKTKEMLMITEKNKIKYKILISILFGLMGFVLNFHAINFAQFVDFKVSILTGLLFPLLISLSWGWKFGLLSALAGGCQSMWWLWYTDGYGFLYAVPIFTLWIVWHGIWASYRKKNNVNNRWYYSIYVVELIFRLFSESGFYTIFRWLVSLNPPPWNPDITWCYVSYSWVNFVVIKHLVTAYILLLIAHVLLNLSPVRKFFLMPHKPSQESTTYVISTFILLGISLWIVDSIVVHYIFQQKTDSFLTGITSDILPRDLFVRNLCLFVCLISGLLISKFIAEKQSAQLMQNEAVRAGNIGLWDWNLITNTIEFSNEWKRQIGYETHEIKNDFEEWRSRVHPDDLENTLQQINDNIHHKKDEHHSEFRFRHKDGSYHWILVQASIFKDEKGTPVRMLGSHIDITRQKQTEIELQTQKELLEGIFDSINDTIIVLLPDLSIIHFNAAGFTQLGLNENTIIGKKCYELFGKDKICDICMTSKMYASKKTETTEKYIPESDKYFLCSCNPILDDNHGNIKLIILQLSDITEQKKIDAQLRQSQKMEAIGTLAGGIAHDFNNILSVITGNISYSLSFIDKDQELFEVLSDAQEGIKQAQNLTQQLLTFSKGGEPIKKVADINYLVKEAALFVTRGSKSKCKFVLSKDLWAAEVDQGQINQVINNIVINANQSMPSGGIIFITSENKYIESDSIIPLPPGNYITIAVEDQGIGISEKHLSNIFEPFFTTKQKGNGLGLAISYSIVKRHGGHISVYSEIEQGTVFYVYLPASAKVIQTSEEQIVHTHTGQGKILIMDDQESILKISSKIINRMGYQTELATDGTQAIDLFRKAYQSKNPFDLVILDLTIPGGIGGAKTIPELLKIDPTVKAIVSSGYSNDPIMANYENYGFCGVIPKPYTKDQLSKLFNKIFGEV